RIGHGVLRLRRVAIGPLRDPDLPLGGIRELTESEVEKLRKATSRLKKPRPAAKPAAARTFPAPGTAKVDRSRPGGREKKTPPPPAPPPPPSRPSGRGENVRATRPGEGPTARASSARGNAPGRKGGPSRPAGNVRGKSGGRSKARPGRRG